MSEREDVLEFLVEIELDVPPGRPQSEVTDRENAEAAAAAKLVDEGHLVRLWRRPSVGDGPTVVGSTGRTARPSWPVGAVLCLAERNQVTNTPLAPHPKRPA